MAANIKTVNIQQSANLTADFTFVGADQQAPATVTFTNISANATSYEWDFGDGNVSTDANPSHIYSFGGNFVVKLTAKSLTDSKTVSKTLTIKGVSNPPIANFGFSGADNPAPAVITFTNNSSNATSYEWDFGDGGTSTLKNPQHTFVTGGSFTVKLTALGQGGSNSISKSINIDDAPSSVEITAVRVAKIPFQDGSGSDFDYFDGPDVFFAILNSSETVLVDATNYRFENVENTDLPLDWSFNTALAINNYATYYIDLYDYDPLDSNDYMGGVSFNGGNYSNYPSEVSLNNGSVKITLYLNWY